MSCGIIPTSSNKGIYLPSRQAHLHLPARIRGGGCGRAGVGWSGQSPLTRWTGLRLSSSFKTRAAVEEGGFIGETRESFYELLGISEGGSYDDIKRAYKQLARKYHPDVSPPDQTEEYTRRFIEVQEAYETLSDPSLRALYDRDLARGLHLAFSARRRLDEDLDARSQWRNRWHDQLAELKRRSKSKDSEENLSWGARMRLQRNESSME